VFASNKYPLKDQLTRLLLIVFLLIKANPGYYVLQYSQVRNLSNSRQSLHFENTRHTNTFLVKLDKSDTERIDNKHVPEIRFAGISFVLFFMAFPIIYTRKPRKRFNYLIPKNEACIGECILRL